MEEIARHERGAAFKALHLANDAFVMPNAWDAGSARVLAAEGFAAIATTSAGIAFAAGLPDHQRIDRDGMLAHIKPIVDSVHLPVSADLESGYAIAPEAAAETVARAIALGAVGANIEDYTGVEAKPLFEEMLAVERIRAIRQRANATGVPFTLTARTDAFLVGHPKAFDEAVRRTNLYREAGADCLFVPGIADAATIAALVKEIAGPINVVMGLSGNTLTLAQLRDLGVRRISIGGSLARAALELVRCAAREMREHGSFSFADRQYAHAELCRFFASWDRPPRGRP
jgi:2-methylisocitrate lyase-like PEP mutase family enzyme